MTSPAALLARQAFIWRGMFASIGLAYAMLFRGAKDLRQTELACALISYQRGLSGSRAMRSVSSCTVSLNSRLAYAWAAIPCTG